MPPLASATPAAPQDVPEQEALKTVQRHTRNLHQHQPWRGLSAHSPTEAVTRQAMDTVEALGRPFGTSYEDSISTANAGARRNTT